MATPDAGAEQHGRGGDHGVEPRGVHGRGEQAVERDRLLAETVRGAEQREHRHDDGDEHGLAPVQALHERGDARIERAELVDDAQAAAQDEQEERDLDAIEEARDGRHEDVGDRRGGDVGHELGEHDGRQPHEDRDDDQDGVGGDHDLLRGGRGACRGRSRGRFRLIIG